MTGERFWPLSFCRVVGESMIPFAMAWLYRCTPPYSIYGYVLGAGIRVSKEGKGGEILSYATSLTIIIKIIYNIEL